MFSMHPKVPDQIKHNISETFAIKSKAYDKLQFSDNVKVKTPEDPNGASTEEIIKWFSNSPESVLKFHSLYNAFKGFTKKEDKEAFETLTKNAFKKAVYRQY